MNLYNLYKSLLTEGLTPILYHFTSIHNLINILKEDEFQASTNLGSSADFNVSGGKFFFFSTTRSRSAGYNQGNVKIVLDGQKLNQNYKGQSPLP